MKSLQHSRSIYFTPVLNGDKRTKVIEIEDETGYIDSTTESDFCDFVKTVNDLKLDIRLGKAEKEGVLSFLDREKDLCENCLRWIENDVSTDLYIVDKFDWIQSGGMGKDVKMDMTKEKVIEELNWLNSQKDIFNAYLSFLESAIEEINLHPIPPNSEEEEQNEISEHLKILKKKSYIDKNNKLLESEILVIELILKLKNKIPLTDTQAQAIAKIQEIATNKRLRGIDNRNLIKYKLVNKQNKIITRFRDVPEVKKIYKLI